MSAFEVSEATVYVLVEAGRRGEVRWWSTDPAALVLRNEVDQWGQPNWSEHGRTLTQSAESERLGDLGAMLWAENRRSVDYRYNEEEWERAYVHPTRYPMALTPAEVLAAVRCYEYQSCEHPGWWSSEARQYVQAIEGHYSAELARSQPQAPYDWTWQDVQARGGRQLGKAWRL